MKINILIIDISKYINVANKEKKTYKNQVQT